MTYEISALHDPDPYTACLWGVTKHPRYHDCENCDHAKSVCETGMNTLTRKAFREAIADGQAMLASYPKLNPARLP